MEEKKKPKTKAGKRASKVTAPEPPKVKDLIDAFKGTLVTDQDKMGYVNFRYPGSKRIVFYCATRNFGVTVSLHDDSTKSGYRSERILSQEDLQTFVASIQAQVDNTSKYAIAFIPIYRCPCGLYETPDKRAMVEHIKTHEQVKE